MKKIRIKKRRKTIKLKYIMCIFIIFLVTIGIAYSAFSTDLTISGTVIGTKTQVVEGNTKYTYTIRGSWPGVDVPLFYDVYLRILNLDEDYFERVEISFDISEGFVPEKSQNKCGIWQAESITQVGNRVTILFSKNTSWLPKGSALDMYFQFPFEKEANIEITNLTLNGKSAVYFSEV